jgi:hypothetical protein
LIKIIGFVFVGLIYTLKEPLKTVRQERSQDHFCETMARGSLVWIPTLTEGIAESGNKMQWNFCFGGTDPIHSQIEDRPFTCGVTQAFQWWKAVKKLATSVKDPNTRISRFEVSHPRRR